MTAIAFDCGACVETSPDQAIQDVLEDHYATCRLCLNEEEQDHVDSLHAHRTAEEIDARCGQYLRICDVQERAKDDPDYALPISGDILTKLRSDK
ncbi:hypothetical protein [Brevibacterium antiquum]|uniref:Uncharacterized protein n=1 Tax=Brevibacterium antiquum TaxID=234835 RepID=A0A2H1IMP8_9MICO|nr:hypothetical protein [Brevibacterium antiquum]SMX76434.1 hypothetical protein BANT10_01094 [Brevibacterium antiquum]